MLLVLLLLVHHCAVLAAGQAAVLGRHAGKELPQLRNVFLPVYNSHLRVTLRQGCGTCPLRDIIFIISRPVKAKTRAPALDKRRNFT